MITLRTKRLILRAFEEADAPDVYAYARNEKVGPPAGWAPHLTMEDSLRFIRMTIQADDVWAVVSRESGRVVGSIGLHKDLRRNHVGARTIGYVLSEDHWGRGLMPEAVAAVMRHAFETLDVRIISAVYFPFNTKSRRVMEKCGMRYEGTLRMATQVYSGEIYDDVCLSITAEEWRAWQQEPPQGV